MTDTCEACGGTGELAPESSRGCPNCNGSGTDDYVERLEAVAKAAAAFLRKEDFPNRAALDCALCEVMEPPGNKQVPDDVP